MREVWRETKLGDVVNQVRRPTRVVPGEAYNLLGVRWYGNGPFLREVGVGGTIKATQLYAVHRGDFIYNRLFAWKGSFGIVNDSLDGSFVSGEFPVFATEASLLSVDYLNLLMCRPSVWSVIEKQSTGSTATSRNRWKEERFLGWEILLPPLAEQRRIVDLIAAVDAAIEAAEQDCERSKALLGGTLREWNGSWAGSRARLGDLAEIGSGPSWSSKDESVEPLPGSRRVLGITNTPPSGEVDMGHVTYVSRLPTSTRLLTSASLLMIRTNGNRSRIGNIYRVPVEAEGAAFSAFQIGITLKAPEDAEFTFWTLASPDVQERISNEASGSTGLGNVAVRWLRELSLPWPERDDREAASVLFGTIASHSRQCSEVVAQLRQLRSALLGDLLSGDHEIPGSYDELLSA